MYRISTSRSRRRILETKPAKRRDRTAEAAIMAAGVLVGGLLVASQAAYGGENRGPQLALAPTATMTAPAGTAGTTPTVASLDLTVPAASIEAAATPVFADRPKSTARVTELDAETRLYGLYRLEIDLYRDDMRPRSGRAPR